MDSLPFDLAAKDARELIARMGAAGHAMEELYARAIQVSAEIKTAREAIGDLPQLPAEMLRQQPLLQRKMLEAQLLDVWAQACAQLVQVFVSNTLIQALNLAGLDHIVRVPAGTRVVDSRTHD